MSQGRQVTSATHAEVSAMLLRHDSRYTRVRRRLVEVLVEAGRPITMPELLESDDALSQSSVYRNLDILEQAAVIRRLTTGGEYAYFELSESLLGHHHHLICVDCGVVEDIELASEVETQLDEALASAAEKAGFKPLHHSLDLHGQCSSCS